MPVLERRLREKEARRSQIVDSARELFFSKGFESTTMDDIARKTELSKGAIYLYFPSKEEIYFTLMEEGVGILYSMLEKASKGNVPADTLLRRIGHAYFDFYRRYPGYFRSLFLYYSSSEMQSKISTELCAKCEEQANRCLMVVAGVIEKGVQSGLFKPCNAFEFAVMTWTSQNGIILLGERGDYQQLKLATTMERIQDLFLESVIVALKHGR